MTVSRSRLLAVLFAGILVSAAAHARPEPFAETPEEKALCSTLVYGGMDKISRIQLEGQEKWGHTHHYCDCVRFRYRALKNLGDRRAVNYNLGIAIGGCDYVLNRVPQDHVLRSKIHVDKGRALKLRGDVGAALQEFEKAIQIDPHEVNAYVELSELERADGNARQALETVTQGLRHNPDAKVLRRNYLELGGKEPFPQPYQKKEEASAAKEPPTPDGLQLAPKQDGEIVGSEHSESTGEDDEPGSDPQAATAAQGLGDVSVVPERGCRFCPPPEILQRWNDSFSPDRGAGAAVEKPR